MGYDSANYTVRREINEPNVAGVASTSLRKFHMFQAAKLKAVHALIVTAGTNTDAGIDIYVGTASVGAITLGTDTAGTVKHSATLNTLVPANGLIEIKGKATSATLVASLVIEYHVTPDAVETL